MGIEFEASNFSKVADKLHGCCLSEDVCGSCEANNCLIKYGKDCIKYCMINKVSGVLDGYKNIPLMDTKVYDELMVIEGIADILKTCKNCSENHYENCIINILRNCYEIILTGHEQEYKGSTLLYLSELKENNPELSDKILQDLWLNKKNYLN
ncbi:hypothetical protein AK964_07855 [Clostridium butyricum]|nr:hypothetical protein AK964_07855 [Clostridium butyricum]